jgi:hypothetical protein
MQNSQFPRTKKIIFFFSDSSPDRRYDQGKNFYLSKTESNKSGMLCLHLQANRIL